MLRCLRGAVGASLARDEMNPLVRILEMTFGLEMRFAREIRTLRARMK